MADAELDDAKLIIVSVFRTKGKSELSEAEFAHTLTFGFRWFSPTEVRDFLSIAIKLGLLREKNKMLIPNFNTKIDIPITFKPDEKIIQYLKMKNERKDILSRLIDKIVSNTNLSKKEVISKINKKQRSLGIEIEAAAILVGYETNVDVSEFIKDVETEILKRVV